MKESITTTIRLVPLFLSIFCFLTNTNAQHNNSELPTSIDANGAAPDASAMLDVQATDKGILIPRVANTSAISNPAEGLVVYDNSDDDFKFYDGLEWQSMGLKHISFLPSVGSAYIGFNAGNLETGDGNTAIGHDAMFSNTTGRVNTATGRAALYSNTTGYHNTATGHSALFSNTTGALNTAHGYDVLSSNTTGNLNTASGVGALGSNTTGSENTAAGVGALGANTEGTFNVAVGRAALISNTTGVANTAIGRGALIENTMGVFNTASGYQAMPANTTGRNNAAKGGFALRNNTTGENNTAIGHEAMNTNTTGNNNTAIGWRATPIDSAFNNCTAIGAQAEPTSSNQVRIGNASITEIGGYTNWTNVSDARFKTQVQNNVPGLSFISRLNPVTYQMDMDAIAKHHNTPEELRLKDSENAKAAIRYTGFLAQDVEKAAESVGYDFSGVDAPQHERDNYSLRYAEFVVPLVKAVQELDAEKDKEIAALKQQNADLEVRLETVEAMLRQRVNTD